MWGYDSDTLMHGRKALTFLLCFLFALPLSGQGEFTPEKTDSLLVMWYHENYRQDNINTVPELDSLSLTSIVSDEVMMQRLAGLNPYFSLPFNEVVKNYMIVYSEKRGETMQRAMRLSDYYFPIFEETFRRYSLPLELKYLAVVESMLNPTATSRAGAMGLWQFMFKTARSYGLSINSYVDERLDVEKSTDAAARYLLSLYEMLGDWPLAISAYNCGAGNVNKAIRRAGGKRDFWSVYPYLPRETRGYMPAFVGVMYAFNYSREDLPDSLNVGAPIHIDTFEVRKNLHFRQISEVVGVPLEDLRYLNPKYYRDIIPGSSGTCIVNIPYSWSPSYLSVAPDSLYAYKADEYLSDKVLKDAASSSADGNGVRTLYRVKSGDTLSHIAKRYRVSVRQLMNWNHLRSDRLSIGQKIYIY
ncbi:MAG: transglycosylase SLT domain-containing protein [Bacteroidales bacterium]|nr:transglycosylase SLT domain-containing protein [Bacteroidales bacterium]